MTTHLQTVALLAVAGLLLGGCPVDPNQNNNWTDAGLDRTDDDGDGFSEAEGDCDDTNNLIHPDAQEIVDGIDNNCDGLVDDDLDGDGFGVVDGDCNDHDATIHPLARENCSDGIDNNCNGYIDADEPDKDGDGFGPCDGDCNDNNIWISPGNVEDPTDGVDNNCDGNIDEPLVTCDCSGEPGMTPEEQAARALGLCNEHQILSASFIGNPTGYGVYADWGAILPRTSRDASSTDGWPQENCKFLILSTGQAKNPDPQSGEFMDLGIWGAPDPAPTPDGANVNDLTQFEIQLRVPGNAKGFSFDFIFFSVEYPEFVCSTFNDTFYALVIGDPALGGGLRTNVSFDSENNEITVNAGFFEYPPYWSLDITGTQYEIPESWQPGCNDDPSIGCVAPNPCPSYKGSTTGWLRTTAPATPGADITLIFSIHDEGDSILDSAVIVDNFRWQTVPIEGPGTVK